MLAIQTSGCVYTCQYSRRIQKIGKADKLRFFNIAQGSLEECRYYCLLARDLGYIDENKYASIVNAIQDASFFLNSYIKGVVDNAGIKD